MGAMVGVCVDIWCWKCIKRKVDKPLDECGHCLDAERKRIERAKKQTHSWSESTHAKHRAPLEAVEWELTRGVKGVQRPEW